MLSRIIFELYRACHEHSVNTFQDWAFERIKSVLPFDSALWLSGTLNNGHHVVHSLHLHKQPPQVIQGFEHDKERKAFAERTISSAGVTFSSRLPTRNRAE